MHNTLRTNLIAALLFAIFGSGSTSLCAEELLTHKYGYIDHSGKFVIKPIYDQASSFEEGIAFVRTRSRREDPLQAIDTSGQLKFTVDEPTLNLGFRAGVLPANPGILHSPGEDRDYGFLDKSGKFLVPQKYRQVKGNHDGLLEVEVQDENGHRHNQIVSTKGNVLYDFDKPATTFNKLGLHVFRFGEQGFYTHENRPEPHGWFKEGLAIASASKGNGISSGYIDFSGKFVVPPLYVGACDFSEGLAHVVLPGQPNHNAFIDKTGRIVITLADDIVQVGDMHEGMAAFAKENKEFGFYGYNTKKVGFIDKTGKIAIPAVYETFRELPEFSEGLALVRHDNRAGFIDKSGELRIPYGEYAEPFHDGLAVKIAYMDKSGKIFDTSGTARGYQTLEAYTNFLSEELTKKLGVLAPQKNVRFKFVMPNLGKVNEVKILHSSGSPSLDKEIVDILTAFDYPKPGELIGYGGETEFVLWNHVVTPGHTKDDPFFKELQRQRELSSKYPTGTNEAKIKAWEELVALDELLVDDPDTVYSHSWNLLLLYRDTQNWSAYEKLARKMYSVDLFRGFDQLKEAYYHLHKTDELAALVKAHEERLRDRETKLMESTLIDGWIMLGDAYVDNKMFDKAEKEYRKCFDGAIDQFTPHLNWQTFSNARWRLIFLHILQKRFELARTDFATMVQHANAHNEPYTVVNNPFIQNYLAAIYQHSPTEFDEDVARVMRTSPPGVTSRWGFIDGKGNVIVPGKFSDAGEFRTGLANVSILGLWGFVDRRGDWKISPMYYAATNFSDGLSCVTQSCLEDFPKLNYIHNPVKWDKVVDQEKQTLEGYFNDEIKCGFIDTLGKFQIPPKRTVMATFGDGVVAAQDDSQHAISLGVLDRSGKFVLPPKFYSLGHFNAGVASATVDDGRAGYNPGGHIGFMLEKEHSENVFLPGTHAGEDDFYAHRINPKPASKEFISLYGYSDLNGKFVIPPSFERAERFSDGLAAVEKDGTWGFIDARGVMRIDNKFDRAFPFQSGVARVQKNGKTGLIDRNGKFVCMPKYETIGEFNEGFAITQSGELTSDPKCNFVDSNGNYLSPTDFEKVRPFSNGLAAVRQKNHWGFINKAGNVVIEPQFEDARDFSENVAAVLFSAK